MPSGEIKCLTFCVCFKGCTRVNKPGLKVCCTHRDGHCDVINRDHAARPHTLSTALARDRLILITLKKNTGFSIIFGFFPHLFWGNVVSFSQSVLYLVTRQITVFWCAHRSQKFSAGIHHRATFAFLTHIITGHGGARLESKYIHQC